MEAKEIIKQCHERGIRCGDKMEEALLFVERMGGTASIDEVFVHCQETMHDPPTERGLRDFFNRYDDEGFLYYNKKNKMIYLNR